MPTTSVRRSSLQEGVHESLAVTKLAVTKLTSCSGKATTNTYQNAPKHALFNAHSLFSICHTFSHC